MMTEERKKLYEIFEYLTLTFVGDPTYWSYVRMKNSIWSVSPLVVHKLAKTAMQSLQVIYRCCGNHATFVSEFFYAARRIYNRSKSAE